MRALSVALLLSLFACDAPRAAPTPRIDAPPRVGRDAELDRLLKERIDSSRFPGLAACVIRDGRIVWAEGYGYANLEERRRFTPDSVFQLASVSKTIVVTALMQLYERGLFTLDEPIDGFLPFRVRSPRYPDVPITFRMLLTHTSSISDDWEVLATVYGEGDSDIPLETFLRDYLLPGGSMHAESFSNARPGTAYDYANTGIDLAAFLVERISRQPFDAYTREHVFTPLGMNETSWRLRDLDRAHVAMPYERLRGAYRPHGLYGYPDYPDGLLRTSVRQLARFLMMFMGDGTYGGARLLRPETVAEIRRVQFPSIEDTQGLVWQYSDVDGARVLGHDGAEYGVATWMIYDVSRRVGVIVLLNADDEDDTLSYVAEVLLDAADRL